MRTKKRKNYGSKYPGFLFCTSLREKCPCSEFFWSIFSRIPTEYGPENLRIRTLFYAAFAYEKIAL